MRKSGPFADRLDSLSSIRDSAEFILSLIAW